MDMRATIFSYGAVEMSLMTGATDANFCDAQVGAEATLTWAFGVADLILPPFQLFTGGLLPPPVPAITYLWFGGLIGISTVFAFFVFTFA